MSNEEEVVFEEEEETKEEGEKKEEEEEVAEDTDGVEVGKRDGIKVGVVLHDPPGAVNLAPWSVQSGCKVGCTRVFKSAKETVKRQCLCFKDVYTYISYINVCLFSECVCACVCVCVCVCVCACLCACA